MLPHIHQGHVYERIRSAEILRGQRDRPLEGLLGEVVIRNVSSLSGLLQKAESQRVVSCVVARHLFHMILHFLKLLVRLRRGTWSPLFQRFDRNDLRESRCPGDDEKNQQPLAHTSLTE